MGVEEATMERLAFIKYLHLQAEQISQQPRPHSSTAILGFHDSVELFLVLASEEVNAGNKYSFMEYWEEIKRNSDTKLTQKASMKRLNKARVNLKHYGNRPNADDIESHRANVRSFFEENTKRIFGIEYSEVTLVDLIQFDNTKQLSEEAEQKLKNNKFGEAVCFISAAFDDMFDEFDDRVRDQLGYTPYPTPKHRITSPNITPGYGTESGLFADVDSGEKINNVNSIEKEAAITLYKIESYLDDLGRNLDSMYEALRIVSLGIDQPRYQRFNSLIPEVSSSGEPKFHHWDGESISENEARFCLDFLIEVALRLQEVPLDFDDEPDTPQSLFEF
jgi:hypothetical protein